MLAQGLPPRKQCICAFLFSAVVTVTVILALAAIGAYHVDWNRLHILVAPGHRAAGLKKKFASMTGSSAIPATQDQAVSLMCRIAIQSTLYENDHGEIREDKEMICHSIVDGKYGEEFTFHDNVFPKQIHQKHKVSIADGDLFLTLTGVTTRAGQVVQADNDNDDGVGFELVLGDPLYNMPPRHRRRLQRLKTSDDSLGKILRPFGRWSFAIVRVTTPDSEVTVSTQTLKDYYLDRKRTNVRSQYL